MKKKDAQTLKTEVDSQAGQEVTFPEVKRTHRAVYFFGAAAVLVVLLTVIIFFFSQSSRAVNNVQVVFPDDRSLVYEVEVGKPTIKKFFKRVIIRWEKPDESTFSEVIIEKEAAGIKTVLYRGNGTRFVDKEYEENSSYRIICISSEGYFSRGKVVTLSE